MKQCLNPFELMTKLQEDLKFAFHKKYGFITTNPKYVGLALKIKICIQIPESKWTTFRANLANMNIEYSFLNIKEVKGQNGLWILKNNKSMGFTEEDLLKAVQKTISFLLTDIADIEKVIGLNEIGIQMHEEEEIEEPEAKEDQIESEIDLEPRKVKFSSLLI